jgi:hypothetical protein
VRGDGRGDLSGEEEDTHGETASRNHSHGSLDPTSLEEYRRCQRVRARPWYNGFWYICHNLRAYLPRKFYRTPISRIGQIVIIGADTQVYE